MGRGVLGSGRLRILYICEMGRAFIIGRKLGVRDMSCLVRGL